MFIICVTQTTPAGLEARLFSCSDFVRPFVCAAINKYNIIDRFGVIVLLLSSTLCRPGAKDAWAEVHHPSIHLMFWGAKSISTLCAFASEMAD